MQRIVLHVDDPATLDIEPAGDSAVGVYFPSDGSAGSVSVGRHYSLRHHDGPIITVDVTVHTGGPGTRWALTAEPGDRVGLDHARSWYRPAADTAWQLLVADLAGLPAAARIVDELAEDAEAVLVVEVADPGDLGYLPEHPLVTVIPLVGSGNGCAPSALARTVEALRLPEGRGYCWFAGEAAESRAARRHLRGLGWTIDQYDVSGYWRFDSEAWDQRFAELQDDVVAVYQRALADGKSDKVALEEFDEACARVGL